MKHNQEVIERWADALLSGRYQQCSGFLSRGDRWCALGVLADVLQIPLIEDEAHSFAQGVHVRGIPFGSTPLVDTNGVDSGVLPEVIGLSCAMEVTDMNDSGVSFPEIAAWLLGGSHPQADAQAGWFPSLTDCYENDAALAA